MSTVKTRIVAVQKGSDEFRAGDRVFFDREQQIATATPTGLLFGLAAAAAGADRFAVLAHIPIADPKDLKCIQCADTGRRMADGVTQLVVPFLIHRRFVKDDRPEIDRHPVEFLEECLQAESAELDPESTDEFAGLTEDELAPPAVELAVQDTAAPTNPEDLTS